MKALGYKSWGSSARHGDETYTTWRGRDASQCVQVMVRNGTIRQVVTPGDTTCS